MSTRPASRGGGGDRGLELPGGGQREHGLARRRSAGMAGGGTPVPVVPLPWRGRIPGVGPAGGRPPGLAAGGGGGPGPGTPPHPLPPSFIRATGARRGGGGSARVTSPLPAVPPLPRDCGAAARPARRGRPCPPPSAPCCGEPLPRRDRVRGPDPRLVTRPG